MNKEGIELLCSDCEDGVDVCEFCDEERCSVASCGGAFVTPCAMRRGTHQGRPG